MDTNKIKAVLRAAELNSFSKAAEELSYTPSAFSHIADSLENELNVVLLKRSCTGVEWTEEGKKLYPELVAMVEQEEKLLNKARATFAGETTVTLAVYASISRTFLPAIIKKVREQVRGVKLKIIVADGLNAFLENDVADVVVTENRPKGNGYVYKEFFNEDYVAVFPSNARKNKLPVTKEELYEYPIITSFEYFLKDFFDMKKFKEVIQVVSDDDASVIKMVKEGIGVTVLPSLTVKGVSSGVSVYKLKETIKRTLGIAYKKDNPKIKEIKKIASFFNIEKSVAAQIE